MKRLRGRARALDPNGFDVRASDTDVLDEAEAMEAHDDDTLLTPSEVAAMFRVNHKTVTRWAASGRITSIRTPGGHRRFRESEVRALLRGENETSAEGHPALLSGPPG